MKMDMSAKPKSEEPEETGQGEYSQEQLEEMLEVFTRAKKMESDPVLMGLLKDYAKSKNRMIDEMFGENVGKEEKPKSLKDLKKRKAKVDEEK